MFLEFGVIASIVIIANVKAKVDEKQELQLHCIQLGDCDATYLSIVRVGIVAVV